MHIGWRVTVGAIAVGWLSVAVPNAERAAVQVGFCGGLKDVVAAKAAGFDYIELGTTEIAGLSDDAFEAALAQVKASGLPVPVTNLFLPGTLKVTGPVIDRDAQMAYVTKAFSRLARLGTTIVVFGSGGARRVPDGFNQQEAFAQLVDFGKRIAPEAQKRGITIAIEPLRRQESNIINSAAEGLTLVKAIDHPNFQLMIDFFHLASEKEDPAIVDRGGPAAAPPAHREPAGPRVPAEVGRVRLRAVFRPAAGGRLRQAHQRRGLDEGLCERGAAGDRAASTCVHRHWRTRARRALPARPARAGASGTAAGHAACPARAADWTRVGRARGRTPARPIGRSSSRPRVERGTKIYAVECVTCHGASARGTERGPSLIRSALVLSDRQGAVLGPFFAKGHPMQSGRPSSELTHGAGRRSHAVHPAEVSRHAARIAALHGGGHPHGDPTAGEAYFNGDGKCTTCHSLTGDLAGDRQALRQRRRPAAAHAVSAARPRRQPGAVARHRRRSRRPAAQPLSGALVAEDDFFVTVS